MIGPTYSEFMSRAEGEWSEIDRILVQTIAMLSTTSFSQKTPDVIWDVARLQATAVREEESEIWVRTSK